jgi:hypothetical protein
MLLLLQSAINHMLSWINTFLEFHTQTYYTSALNILHASHYRDPISNLMPLTLELVQTVITISRNWTSVVHSCIHPWWNHSFPLYKVIFKYTRKFLVHLYISNTMHIVRLYWQHVCCYWTIYEGAAQSLWKPTTGFVGHFWICPGK